MPVEYEYDAATGVVSVRPHGVLTLSEIQDYFARLAADDAVAPGAVEIVRFAQVGICSLAGARRRTWHGSCPVCGDYPLRVVRSEEEAVLAIAELKES